MSLTIRMPPKGEASGYLKLPPKKPGEPEIAFVSPRPSGKHPPEQAILASVDRVLQAYDLLEQEARRRLVEQNPEARSDTDLRAGRSKIGRRRQGIQASSGPGEEPIKSQLRTALDGHLSDILVPTDDWHVCPDCGSRFGTASGLRSHRVFRRCIKGDAP